MHALRRAVAVAGLSVLTITGALAVTAETASAAGANIYVAPSTATPAGNDTATCGPSATPCRTVAYAYVNRAVAGDIINVRNGTYLMTQLAAAAPVANTNQSRLNITKSITIQKDPADTGTVTFDGNNTAVANSPIILVNTAGVSLALNNITVTRGNGGAGAPVSGSALFLGAGSVSLTGDTFSANNSTAGWGAAIYAHTGTTLTASGSAFANNTALNGGAVYLAGAAGVTPGANASFQTTSFTSNRGLGAAVANSGNGGAIYNSGNLTLTGTTFTSNGVTQSSVAGNRRGYGGSLFNGPTDNDDAPTATIASGITISGVAPSTGIQAVPCVPAGSCATHATVGGAIANVAVIAPAATGTTAGVLTGGPVNITGAVGLIGGGIYSSGTANLTGGTISGDKALPFTGVGTTGSGAGVYNAAGTMTLTGMTISGGESRSDPNTAATGLGGAAVNVGTLNLSGSTLSGNAANGTPVVSGTAATLIGLGGGLYNGGTATLTAGTAVQNNTATAGSGATTGNGGGIYNAGALTVTGSTISGNTATGGAGANTGEGGGIYSSTSATVQASSSITGNNATAGLGTPGGLGGGIYAQGTALTVSASTVGTNTATASATTQTGNGGGIYTQATTTSITGSTISTNTATTPTASQTTASTGSGGGIEAVTNLTLTSSQVTGNKAIGSAGATSGIGGGVLQVFGTSNVTGTTIANNTASGTSATSATGGGFYNFLGTATIGGGTIAGNMATLGGGLATAGTTTLNNPDIVGNHATAGGGIYNTITLTINTAEVTNNDGLSAGGIYNSGGTLTASDLALDDNIANGTASVGVGIGGGLYNANVGTNVGTVHLTDGSIDGNTAATAAGVFNGGVVTTDGTTIDENTATPTVAGTGAGGGIYTTGAAATVTLLGGSVSGNGSNNGAGVFTTSAVDATSTAIDGNTVTASGSGTGIGGGVYASGAGADVSLTDGSVSGNTAVVGGGIANVGGTVTLDGTAVADNDAASAAGIYNTGTLTTDGATITGNTATATVAGSGLGGGLFNAGTATLTGGTLSGNTADAQGFVIAGLGGGAFNSTGSLSLSQVTAADNHALGSATIANQSGWGGAIYNGSNADDNTAELTIDQSTLSGNSAVYASGVLGYAPGDSSAAKASIHRSTLSGNLVTQPGGGTIIQSTGAQGSIVESTFAGNGSGLVSGGNAVTNVSGSILFGNGATSCASAAPANVVDGGRNLTTVGDTSCGFSVGGGDIFGDPQLGALADNGGPTETRLPGPSSPALDKIAPAYATGVNDAVTGAAITLCTDPADQRGAVRPAGANCDVGSVEVAQIAPTIDGPPSGTFVVGTSSDLTPDYTATGSPTPTISATGLPSGLSIVSTGAGTAKITGNAAAGTGGVYNVTVKASNEAGQATMPVTITVNEAPTSITGPATIHMIETISGPTSNYSSSVVPTPTLSATGTFPSGVTFTAGPPGAGTIDGTPPLGSAGTYHVTVKATNVAGSVTKDVTIEVVPLLNITTTSLPDGQHGVTYNQTVAAIGGTTPYHFTLDSGSLPAGLTLNDDGSITGIPTGSPGVSSFVVKATDSSTVTQTDTQALSITIGKGPTVLAVGKVILQQGPFGVNIGDVNATLKGGNPLVGIGGQTIVFKVGVNTVCVGVTNASGFVSCAMTVQNTLRVILAGGVSATYAGNDVWLPSSGSNTLL